MKKPIEAEMLKTLHYLESLDKTNTEADKRELRILRDRLGALNIDILLQPDPKLCEKAEIFMRDLDDLEYKLILKFAAAVGVELDKRHEESKE